MKPSDIMFVDVLVISHAESLREAIQAECIGASFCPHILKGLVNQLIDCDSWLAQSVQVPREFSCDAGTFPIMSGTTIADVRDWLHALNKIGRSWHMDEDCNQIGDNDIASNVLNAQRDAAWSICEEANVDIHSICIALERGNLLPV